MAYENSTPQELVAKLTELNNRRENLVSRHAIAQAKIDHARQERDRLITKEMAELGTGPDTIQQDSEVAKSELRQIVISYEKELNEFEQALKNGESIINS